MWFSKVVCLIHFVGAALAQSQSVVVHLDQQGPVRGYKDVEGDFFSFLDVPYATAPTGVHKFKAPLPPPVWTETFDAVERKIACHHIPADNSITASLIFQEDCLVANVFMPNTNATDLPVLVSVHGGAYQRQTVFTLTNLVKTMKVIVVTFNYRLGVAGFLCLGTDDVPGNAGMKDQVALLRWVNRNIASFGGNPDDVTISGCSAGGGSVDFLTLSPMGTGLFKKAISGSGTVFGLTGPQTDPVGNAKIYAQQLNFTNVDDLAALEEFYKTASYELFLSKADFILKSTRDSLFLFAPCVERETAGERFLHDTPANILKNGNYQKVPLIYGFSEMEGLYRLLESSEWMIGMNEKFADFLPADLQFENEAQKDQVAAKVKSFYFGNQTISENTILTYIDYFTDVMFAYPILRVANMRRASNGDTIYLYKYSFVDENMPLILNTNYRGPGHCAQNDAIKDEDTMKLSNEYVIIKDAMRELWINFITKGYPTPEGLTLPQWPPMDGFASPFMSLKAHPQVERSSVLGERVHFWNSIYSKHYRAPVQPRQ